MSHVFKIGEIIEFNSDPDDDQYPQSHIQKGYIRGYSKDFKQIKLKLLHNNVYSTYFMNEIKISTKNQIDISAPIVDNKLIHYAIQPLKCKKKESFIGIYKLKCNIEQQLIDLVFGFIRELIQQSFLINIPSFIPCLCVDYIWSKTNEYNYKYIKSEEKRKYLITQLIKKEKKTKIFQTQLKEMTKSKDNQIFLLKQEICELKTKFKQFISPSIYNYKCCICCSDYSIVNNVFLVNECGHMFNKECALYCFKFDILTINCLPRCPQCLTSNKHTLIQIKTLSRIFDLQLMNEYHKLSLKCGTTSGCIDNEKQIEKIFDEFAKKNGWRQCPKCSVYKRDPYGVYRKTNLFKCFNLKCRAIFCALDGQELDPVAWQQHFKLPNRCKLLKSDKNL